MPSPAPSLLAHTSCRVADRRIGMMLADAGLADCIPVDVAADPAIYHAASGYGFFTVAQAIFRGPHEGKAKRGWRERHYHVRQAPQVMAGIAGSVDTYITQASFRQFRDGRKISNLSRIGALWVDLDTYKNPAWSGRTPAQLVPLLLQECADQGLPRPSVIVDSGNGLYAKWLLDKSVPEPALKRWRSVQAELCKRLARFEADPKAADAARVLRAVGSINSRTGRPVCVAWQNDSPFDDHGGHRKDGVPVILYDFDAIADEVLCETRERLAQIRAARAAAKAAAASGEPRRNTSGLRRFDARQLASDRHDDLWRLIRMRGWERGAPKGERDMLVFAGASFLALMHPYPCLRTLIAELGARIAPTWTTRELENCVHSVLDRAERSMRGEAAMRNDYLCDARYTPGNAWLISALAITADEQAALKTIISSCEARRRDAERAKARRRAAGAQSRSAFLGHARQRRAQAAALREKGLTWADVGTILGVSSGAARALASRANAVRTDPSVCLLVVKPRSAAQPPVVGPGSAYGLHRERDGRPDGHVPAWRRLVDEGRSAAASSLPWCDGEGEADVAVGSSSRDRAGYRAFGLTGPPWLESDTGHADMTYDCTP